MSAWSSLFALALLWAVAAGVGLLLMKLARDRPGHGLALTTLLGLCALAAACPSMFAIGLPRWSVLAIAYAAALAGWLRHGACAARAIEREHLVVAGVTLLAVAGPLVTALMAPLTSHDAIMVWWPKVVEVATGDPTYVGQATAMHLNPGYPRGLAWLCSLANPLGPPATPVMKLVTLSWIWLTALVIARAARRWLPLTAAISLAVIFLWLPEIADQAGSGMADAGVGAAALLAALGLTHRPHPSGYLVAAVAGVGATAIKAEGAVVLLVVWLHFAVDVVRRPDRRRTALLAACIAAVLLPVLASGSAQPQTRMEVLPFLLENPDVTLIRTVAMLEAVGRFLLVPTTIAEAGSAPLTEAPCWTGLAVMACLLVLAASRARATIQASPAVMLLPVAAWVYVTTSVSVHWHISTTFARLMVEMAPTCLLAAAVCGFAPNHRSPIAEPRDHAL